MCQMTPKQPQQRRQQGLGDEGRGSRCRHVLSPRYVFFYYFLHFLYYANVFLQVPQQRRTATTTTVTLATHHSHLDVSKDPETEMTTKKATRVGRQGQGLKMQTHHEPQVSFFYYFMHFLNYTNVLQVL